MTKHPDTGMPIASYVWAGFVAGFVVGLIFTCALTWWVLLR